MSKGNTPIECGICYDDIASGEARLTLENCGHTFHWKCAKSWIHTMGNKVTCPLCRGLLTRNNRTGPTIRWNRTTAARIRKDIGPFIDVLEALWRTKQQMIDERAKLVVPGMKRRLDTLMKATENETNPIGRACLLSQLSNPTDPRSAALRTLVKLARGSLKLEAKKERLRTSTERLTQEKYEYDLYELISRLKRYQRG